MSRYQSFVAIHAFFDLSFEIQLLPLFQDRPSLGKLLGADILQRADLLLPHGGLDSHHKVLPAVKSILDLINQASDRVSILGQS
jgi:hypothetical protein